MTILFVPLNPAEISWEKGHYFSSVPATWKSSLWYQLYHAKFALKLYSELEADEEVFGNPENHLGIIDLVVDKVSSHPIVLTREDIERGCSTLKCEIQQYNPKIVCFLGKGTYRRFKGIRNSNPVKYGLQRELIGQSKVYVAAFPSSMDIKVEGKIEILKKLHNIYATTHKMPATDR
jgi:hypothetical protein